MVTDVLKMTPTEFEELVRKHSTGKHSEQKYIPLTLEDAEKLAKDGEELVGKGSTRTGTFETAVVLLMTFAEQIWQMTQKNKSFRMELFYDAETLKTNYCFFAPIDKHGSEGKCPESSDNQD